MSSDKDIYRVRILPLEAMARTALDARDGNAFFDEARGPEALIILDTGEGAKGCVVTALCARCADDADTAARRWVRTICDDVEMIDPAREEGHS